MDGHDATFMRAAITEAAKGPIVDPNPRVGAVVLDAAGRLVGTGHHAGAGTPHAEVIALQAAGTSARGGTLYVSLEPCHHTGRTGPCTQAVIAAGISRVVFGQSDPNPQAAGGAAALAAAGVQVIGGILAELAGELNQSWSQLVTTGRPRVTWKYAATLDGYSAASDATSRWITAAPAREDVHRLRAECGAIVVGTGTVLADDPQLTVRTATGDLAQVRQPLRVVVGLRELPATARVLDEAAQTIQVASRNPHQVLQAVAERGIHQAWLEGGPRLAAAFLRAGLVDRVIGYYAASLLGGGTRMIADLGITTLTERLDLVIDEAGMVGPDFRIIAHPATRPTHP